MKKSLRRLLVALVLLALLLPALLWLADRWLESSGGRELLESELAKRIGMPIRIEGDFELMFWPSVGVAGTGLVFGDEIEALRSEKYEIALTPGPLLEGEMMIERFLLDGLKLDTGAFSASGTAPSAEAVELPGIDDFTIRNAEIIFGAGEQAIRIEHLSFTAFRPGSQVPFSLRLEELGRVEGSFSWIADQGLLSLENLDIETPGGQMAASGCIQTGPPLQLRLRIYSQRLDLDPLLERFSGGGSGDSEIPGLDVVLRADELHSRGVLAEGAELQIGQPLSGLESCPGESR